MLRLAESRDEVRVVADQRGCPTSADDIAQAIADVVPVGHEGRREVRHLSHRRRIMERPGTAFAEAIFEGLGREDIRRPLNMPITTADYPTPARRPRNSRLSSERFAQHIRSSGLRGFEAALPAILDEAVGATAGGISSAKRGRRHEGDRARRRIGHAALSDDPRGQQAAPAGLRQADGLLPDLGADAGRDPRHPDHHHAAGPDLYRKLFGDGSRLGMRFDYAAQPKPGGLAQAFIIGRDFVGKDSVTLVLGDNIFFGHSLPDLLRDATARKRGATIFAYEVQDPQRYGVVTFDDAGQADRASRRSRARRRAPGR